MNGLVLVAVALAGAGLLAGCGRQARAACSNLRGDPNAAVSFWSCRGDAEASTLRRRYGFSSCALVQGMDAEAKQADTAYVCRR